MLTKNDFNTQEIINIIEDYEQDLALTTTPPESYKIYYKMLHDDLQLHMIRTALKLFTSHKFVNIVYQNIKNDETKKYLDDLFHRLNLSIYDILSLSIDYLFYGAVFFLKSYQYDKINKKYFLTSLNYIEPASIIDFTFNDKPPYNVETIHFYGRGSNGSIQDYEVNVKDFWIISNAQDSFINGKSALKPAYKLYIIKHFLLQLFPVSASKSAVYIPVAYVKGALDKERERKIDGILAKLNASYNARAVIQRDLIDTIEGLQDKRNPYPFPTYLDFINKELTKTVMANMLSFGIDKTVQYEIQEIYKDLLFGVVDMSIRKVLTSFNNEILKPLYMVNFGNTEDMPILQVKRVGGKIGDVIDSKVLFSLAQYGLITPDNMLENWLRDIMGLPIKEEVNIK